MKKLKRLIVNPDDFSIYESSCDPTNCYAIYPDEIKKMDEIRLNYFNETIPDKFTIKAFKFGKVGVKNSETEVWDIINQKPVECKINDLVSSTIGYKYCY